MLPLPSTNQEFSIVTSGSIELLHAQTVVQTASATHLLEVFGDTIIAESITFGPSEVLLNQLGVMRACSGVFDTLNTVLEDALATVRKCACMTQFDKLIDQGETKRHLIALRNNLFKRCREVFYCSSVEMLLITSEIQSYSANPNPYVAHHKYYCKSSLQLNRQSSCNKGDGIVVTFPQPCA